MMTKQKTSRIRLGKLHAFVTVAVALILVLSSCLAQSSSSPEGKLAFEVASVKENRSTRPASSDFPLDDGESFATVGGLFTATGYTLPFYMRFAFKLTDYQESVIVAELPEWAKMTRFDIEARAAGNPSKDKMREMLTSLLEDRFGLVFHHEMRETPVFWLELAKPGKTAPGLRTHAASTPCSGPTAGITEPHGGHGSNAVDRRPWPAKCGILASRMSKTDLLRVGARDVNMQWIANELTGEAPLGHQLIDHTGLTGTYDFVIEFTPEYSRPLPQSTPRFNENGSSFVQALKEQLGLRLKSQKEPEDTIVIDRLQHPSPN